MLKLDVRCSCGRRPPLAISPAMRAALATIPPDEILSDWRCVCGQVTELPAALFTAAA